MITRRKFMQAVAAIAAAVTIPFVADAKPVSIVASNPARAHLCLRDLIDDGEITKSISSTNREARMRISGFVVAKYGVSRSMLSAGLEKYVAGQADGGWITSEIQFVASGSESRLDFSYAFRKPWTPVSIDAIAIHKL